MKIEFIKPHKLGGIQFDTGNQLEINKDVVFEIMNDKYYLLIFNGLRYDILKEDIKVIENDF
ncbi:MAG: hypothetical protein UFX20_09955 [Longibaculum muris]|uniref:Uncharacterized protein n=1 Tax=Longibaculum muris TaxID=1796628 RepID=A0A4R3YG87_9FIRM|nr:hypothetical protein [Longibaculum muris]KXU42322.1 hypothetical protein HMPREF3037_02924 [Candidatus Stoquefichus sp. KLE1796]MBS5370102.1 hypothetical protein [Coprobacillus cateniformis]MCR1889347.1 hypothetical protein [Longibaculum muris]MED9812410.1 hypothetical protein [Longibaculum muris]TCV91237.1 hypothetical protein EDD60_13319 [Longibaculum muris]